MFNEDSALSSRAARRLYLRIMHEVNIRNSLHVITMLSKSKDAITLSPDTKRELHTHDIIIIISKSPDCGSYL